MAGADAKCLDDSYWLTPQELRAIAETPPEMLQGSGMGCRLVAMARKILQLQEDAKADPLTAFWKGVSEGLAKKLVNARDRSDFFAALAAVPGEKKAPDVATREREAAPYREHTPAQLAVHQAHQALTRHGVPERMTTGIGPAPSAMTLVERIDTLAARSKDLQKTRDFLRDAAPGDVVRTDRGMFELAKPGATEDLRKLNGELFEVGKAAAAVEKMRNKVAKAIAALQEGA